MRNELIARVDELKITPQAVLDLGAGTGHGARALKRRFPKALVVAADIAPGMLERAKRQSRWLRRFERVRARRLHAAVSRRSVRPRVLAVSCCSGATTSMRYLPSSRVSCKPGGLLLFSTFGPGTLVELREAWAASDAANNHVNHFFDPHALGSALMHAGLSEPVLDVDRIVMGYPDVIGLMRELKAIGAHNVTARSRARTHGSRAVRGDDPRV